MSTTVIVIITLISSFLGSAAIIMFFLKRKYEQFDKRVDLLSSILDVIEKIINCVVNTIWEQKTLSNKNDIQFEVSLKKLNRDRTTWQTKVNQLLSESDENSDKLLKDEVYLHQAVSLNMQMNDLEKLIHGKGEKYLQSVNQSLELQIDKLKILQLELFEIKGINLYLDDDLEEELNKFRVAFYKCLAELQKSLDMAKENQVSDIDIEMLFVMLLLDLGSLKFKLLKSLKRKRHFLLKDS